MRILYNLSMNPENPNTHVSSEHIHQEKEQGWREKLRDIDQLADQLGLGVDEGIKETVAAFHVFEINTISSHEGKIDRYPVPYIDVESAGIVELDRRLEGLEDKEDEESEQEAESIREEILRRNLAERMKIIPLLEEFYSERKVPYEVRLGIDSRARGWSRIQSQGAEFQEIESDEAARKQRLRLFQEEMRAFTDFLKHKYFNE